MVNFRYHLVSLISVFLALAVGLVLGAGPLSGPIAASLDTQVEALRTDKEALRSEVADLEAADAWRDAVLDETLPWALGGLLPGRTIAVVMVGGGSADLQNGLADTVEQAGGRVACQLRLTAEWWRADSQRLAEVLEQVRRAGVSTPQPTSSALPLGSSVIPYAVTSVSPGSTDASVAEPSLVELREQLATLLFSSLVAPNLRHVAGMSTMQPAASAGPIIAALENAGMATGGLPTLAADALLIVVSDDLSRPEPATDTAQQQAEEQQDTAVLGLLASAVERSPATVVIGPATSDDDVISKLRKDDALRDRLSTVDGVAQSAVSLTAMLAVAERLRGEGGHYGLRAGKTGGQQTAPRWPSSPRVAGPSITPIPVATAS